MILGISVIMTRSSPSPHPSSPPSPPPPSPPPRSLPCLFSPFEKSISFQLLFFKMFFLFFIFFFFSLLPVRQSSCRCPRRGLPQQCHQAFWLAQNLDSTWSSWFWSLITKIMLFIVTFSEIRKETNNFCNRLSFDGTLLVCWKNHHCNALGHHTLLSFRFSRAASKKEKRGHIRVLSRHSMFSSAFGLFMEDQSRGWSRELRFIGTFLQPPPILLQAATLINSHRMGAK